MRNLNLQKSINLTQGIKLTNIIVNIVMNSYKFYEISKDTTYFDFNNINKSNILLKSDDKDFLYDFFIKSLYHNALIFDDYFYILDFAQDKRGIKYSLTQEFKTIDVMLESCKYNELVAETLALIFTERLTDLPECRDEALVSFLKNKQNPTLGDYLYISIYGM